MIPRRDAAAERARDRAVAAARPALGRRAARPSRARLRPGGDRRLAGAVRARPATGLDALALRHLDAAARRAPPSPAAGGRRRRRVDARSDRCRPSWRRCGNSGVTPGTRASDHRRARLAALGGGGRLRSRDGRTARSRSRSAWGHSAWSCWPLALVLRWPSLVPWADLRHRRAATWAAATGTHVVDGWAAAIGVLLLLGRRARDLVDRARRAHRRASARSPRDGSTTLASLGAAALLMNFLLLGTAAISASASVLLAAAGVAAAVSAPRGRARGLTR